MNMPLWFYDLAVYCAQLAILITAGGLMMAITRLREPRVRLIYWQVLLALGLLLPAIEPWQTAPQVEQGMAQAGERMAHAGSIGIEAAAALPAHPASSFPIYEVVAIVLVAGLLFRLLWLATGLMQLRQSQRHACPLGSHAAVEQFKAMLGVSPAVLVSERISSPVTFGWRKPRVLLPRKFIQMDETRQRAIICHELLHVRRRDWLWHVLEEILRTFFWFHLAVEWLIAQIRLSREQVVDRTVVMLASSRRDYLDALFEIASASSTPRHAPALLFLSERHLKRRVALILKEAPMSRKKLTVALSASLAALLTTGALVVTLLPLKTSAKTSAAQASSAVHLKAPQVRPDTHFYGNPDARLTVVEFGDFQCPACRKAESVAEEVRKNLGDQVRFAYRQFPLTRIHPEAEKAAEAAECAAEQGKFWQAVNYFSDHPLDFSAPGIQRFATILGLDPARVSRCLSSGKMAARVRQDARDGRTLGVHSVPTFFIGSTKLVGVPSYSHLRSLIEQQLRGDGNARSTPPHSPDMPSAASLAPAYAEGLSGQDNGITDVISQKPNPAPDPPAQDNQNASTNTNSEHSKSLNQDEIHRQVEQVMKRAKIAQEAAGKIDQAKIQQQVRQAMEQAKIAQQAARKIDQAKIQKQVEQAMKQAKVAELAAKEINKPEIQQQLEQAMQQAKIAQEAASKINQAEIQQTVKQALDQAKIAQQAAEKVNKAEIRRQIEQAKEQAQAARKEAEKVRQEGKEQRKEVKPPSPPPPSPPLPPAKPRQSTGVVGGVAGGVQGGITGGVTGGPSSPKPAPPSSKELAPPLPPPALPPPPPQN